MRQGKPPPPQKKKKRYVTFGGHQGPHRIPTFFFAWFSALHVVSSRNRGPRFFAAKHFGKRVKRQMESGSRLSLSSVLVTGPLFFFFLSLPSLSFFLLSSSFPAGCVAAPPSPHSPLPVRSAVAKGGLGLAIGFMRTCLKKKQWRL